MAFSKSEKLLLASTRIWLVVLAISLFVTGIDNTRAGNMQRQDSPTITVDLPRGPLDGQSFTGEFGPIGKAADGTDSWVFQNGSFLSKSCLECGFPQSVYSSESGPGVVDFTTTTSCPVSDAEIVWEGTVKNGKIEGVFTWTKKRWYRTVQKRFWFKGRLEDAIADNNDKTL